MILPPMRIRDGLDGFRFGKAEQDAAYDALKNIDKLKHSFGILLETAY